MFLNDTPMKDEIHSADYHYCSYLAWC